jgi:hypothetical protein
MSIDPKNYIAAGDCIDRHIYRIHSRNLKYGIYKEESGGFIGLREKFGSRFLFEEYHADTGGVYGTVCPKEDLGIVLSNEYHLRCQDPVSYDSVTGREVDFDTPVAQGGKGWFFIDTGESDLAIRASSRGNPELFVFMVGIEEEHSSDD